MNKFLQRALLPAAALLASGEALAHAGSGMLHTHGVIDGLLHPVTGWDHALVAIAVGLLVARAPTARWPVLFPAGMALGMAAGTLLPAGGVIESGILPSLLAVGLLLAAPVHRPALVACIIALAGAAHGLVHGAEAGVQPAVLGGVLVATALLQVLGVALGRALTGRALALRGIGVATATLGLVLMAG